MHNAFEYHPCQPGYFTAGSSYEELNYSEDCKIGHAVCQMFEIANPYEHNIKIIPDGCNDILISYDGKKLNSWFSISIPKPTRFQFKKVDWIFGVRFYPGLYPDLFAEYAANRCHPSAELSYFFPDFKNVEEALKSSKSFARRIEIMTDYLHSKMSKHDSIDNILNYCVRRLIESNGNLPVEKLAEEVGYGTRYIRQLFSDNIGHSTKELATIIRMQKTLRYILTNPGSRLSDVAVTFGFSDHSHMNREFKKYMGVTSSIFKETNQWNSILKAELDRIF